MVGVRAHWLPIHLVGVRACRLLKQVYCNRFKGLAFPETINLHKGSPPPETSNLHKDSPPPETSN